MAESEVLVLFKGKDETLSKVAGSVGGAFGKLGGAVKAGAAVGVGAMIGLGAGAVTLGSKLIGLGSDAEEMQGKFNVVFANTGNQVTSALSDFADEVGRSKFELMEMASVFGDTLKPMGFVEQDAASLSIQMSQLATDLGSFNNMSMTESMERLQGVLIGNHENALAFGVIINENTLSAELAANGWDNLTGAALEQAKVQARINLLMAGTTDAQGDAARTAGSWANQMRRLKSRLADAATEAGSKLLPALTPLLSLLGDLAEQALPVLLGAFDKVAPVIENVSQFIQSLVGNLQEGMSPMDAFIEAIWDFAPQPVLDALVNFRDVILPGLIEKITEIKDKIVEFMEPIITWIQQNIELKDALMALGIVLGGIVLASLISIGTAIAPILIAAGALIGLVALVRTAWEENWGGIQEKTQSLMDWMLPKFEELQVWLAENIPVAIEKLKGFWENTLKPAIESVWQFLSETLYPFFRDTLVPWLQEKIPAAIEILRGFWEDTLMPALDKVWTFLTVDMQPVWEALEDLLGVAIPIVLEALQGLWENVLLPAMESVWKFIKEKLGPIFEWLKDTVVDPLSKSFDGTSNAIQNLVDWIHRAKDALEKFELPDVLTPGSPTPFELGLRGIGEQMRILANNDIPQFNNAMQQTGSTTVNAQRTVNQNFTINTSSIDVQSESRAQLAFATGGI
jgi:hypothetical protein